MPTMPLMTAEDLASREPHEMSGGWGWWQGDDDAPAEGWPSGEDDPEDLPAEVWRRLALPLWYRCSGWKVARTRQDALLALRDAARGDG